MKKVIKLTESDLIKIVKRIINEQIDLKNPDWKEKLTVNTKPFDPNKVETSDDKNLSPQEILSKASDISNSQKEFEKIMKDFENSKTEDEYEPSHEETPTTNKPPVRKTLKPRFPWKEINYMASFVKTNNETQPVVYLVAVKRTADPNIFIFKTRGSAYNKGVELQFHKNFPFLKRLTDRGRVESKQLTEVSKIEILKIVNRL